MKTHSHTERTNIDKAACSFPYCQIRSHFLLLSNGLCSDQIILDLYMLPFFILFPFAMPCLTRAIEESDQIARLCDMFVAPVSSWCRTLLPSTSEVFTGL